MWIVLLSLRRPRTIWVMSLLILIFGVLAIVRTPTDMFPQIDMPVVSVVWSYPGLAPQEMEERVVSLCERAYTNTVGDIEHIESSSLAGMSIIKVFFQPGTEISEAVSQIGAVSSTLLRTMPPGTTPPELIRYNATDVPVIQVSLSSDTMSPAALNDYAANFLVPQFVTIQGTSVSPPFGGVPQLVMVDLDQHAMLAHGVTAQGLTTAIASQNLILPAGQMKLGRRNYAVRLNNSPGVVDSINRIPIQTVNGATLYVQDVAHVRMGYGVQTNVVRVNGKQSVLITILKSGNASTLDVVNRVKAALPQIRSTLPEGMKLDLLQDQSVFVTGAVTGVVREALLAAGLTALMILLFLGSWRSTLIVAISIPLSILCSVVVLSFLGYTLNMLTLGGLALAVGMLVDDATVEVENTTRNLGLRLPLTEAIVESARQVALPALSATLSICIVFVPVAFLSGVARYLFLPLALAVVFAMLPSYFLSRTLVTTMLQALLPGEVALHLPEEPGEHLAARGGWIWRIHVVFEHWFDGVRLGYLSALDWAVHHRGITVGLFALIYCGSFFLFPRIGQDFFPNVDAGQIRLHVRAPAGTRLEETTPLFTRIEETIHTMIPPQETGLVVDNIGLASALNYAFSNSGIIGDSDGEIDITLAEKHHSTFEYIQKMREELPRLYPDCTFYFQPADLSTQVLDFGTSAPIDLQITGPYRNRKQNLAIARQMRQEVSRVPGIVDCYMYQITDSPELKVEVNRERAAQVGLTQSDVANNVLVSLSSSSLTAPSYYIDPSDGVQYTVAVQSPQREMSSVQQLENTPISGATGSSVAAAPELLSNVATISRDKAPSIISHYNINPAYDVYAGVQDRDLGGTTHDIDRIVAKYRTKLPRGSTLNLIGQAQTMESSFRQMGLGLIFAIVLVYLLLVINFESWRDPMVILTASPGALTGVVWILYATRTTLSVPSLMGTIMSIGVATANSILLVTFANEQRAAGMTAQEAALAAGFTRFRPVIMTALAMILGMLPMALGMGEGGEQNAPLGRAVVGGLLMATFSTLLFVPLIYTYFSGATPVLTSTPVEPPAAALEPGPEVGSPGVDYGNPLAP